MIKQILFIICILLPCACIVQGELTSIRMYGPTEARDMNLTVDLPEGWYIDIDDPEEKSQNENVHLVTLNSENLTQGYVHIAIHWRDYSERPIFIEAAINDANMDYGDIYDAYLPPDKIEAEIDGHNVTAFAYIPRSLNVLLATGYAIDDRTYTRIFADTLTNDTIQILDSLHIEPAKAET